MKPVPPTGAADPDPAPLPPHLQLADAFPAALHDRLLDWVIANQAGFADACVFDRHSSDKMGAVDPRRRVAMVTGELGDIEQDVRGQFTALLGVIVEAIGYRGPAPTSLELEIATHGDGAHFFPHLDIPVGAERQPLGYGANEDRVLSAVYYFHRLPKGFAGGGLRLFAFARNGLGEETGEHQDAPSIELEPLDNSLVVFPSWVMHEVLPVSCPSGQFADYRFAVNCWFCRPTG